MNKIKDLKVKQILNKFEIKEPKFEFETIDEIEQKFQNYS